MITRIEELLLRDFPSRSVFAQRPEQGGKAADREGGRVNVPVDVCLPLSVHSWLIRDRGRIILVDTGVGNDKPRPFTPYFDGLHTPFLERLAAQGVLPDQVDFVLMTHLHVDHVGWNTRLEEGTWRPTFPNAQYIFSKAEYEYFTEPKNYSERNKTSFIVQQDSIRPIVEAGLARMIEIDGSEVIEGFRFLSTPGHTFDHSSIVFARGADTALFVGDLLHHPEQVHRPEVNSAFDAFADQARESRRRTLEYAAKHNAIVFTTHFTPPSAGRVRQVGGEFAWEFQEHGSSSRLPRAVSASTRQGQRAAPSNQEPAD